MAKPEKVSEAIRWYSQTRPLYEALVRKVTGILEEVLDARGVDYQEISGRAKEVAHYQEKAEREKYVDPLSEIMDMAAVRVVTYTLTDVKLVAAVVKETFEILPQYSIDKDVELGIDRVGYRSMHFIATLGDTRGKLPENIAFGKMLFEIQIRTILAHAWAEFDHDRDYKFSGVLPAEIRRRVQILAGDLELVDRQFDEIAKEIDSYAALVRKKTGSGDLDVPINSTSLKAYLNKRFEVLVQKGLDPSFYGLDEEVIAELQNMGFTKLADLDAAIPGKFVEVASVVQRVVNYTGLLRDVMMIFDCERYFRESWKEHWQAIFPGDAQLLKEFGVDFGSYARKHRLVIRRYPDHNDSHEFSYDALPNVSEHSMLVDESHTSES